MAHYVAYATLNSGELHHSTGRNPRGTRQHHTASQPLSSTPQPEDRDPAARAQLSALF
ncbi:hypothetical protein IWX65_003579 [Arthrobacter sp. CAN_A214]